MNDLITLFAKDNGVFSRFLQFETIVFMLILLFLFTFFFEKNYGFIIILLAFVLYITNIYVGLRKEKVSDFNRETSIYLQEIKSIINKIIEEKLIFYNNSNNVKLTQKDIQRIYESNKLEYMYIDANMIRFIHSFKDLHKYTDRGFYKFIKGVNNILKIRGEIENYYESEGKYPENIAQMFEIAIGLRRNTVNNLHNFIYSMPKNTQMSKYLNSIVERYNVLVSRNLDIIHKYYIQDIKQRGINTTTKFVSYNTTKPYDTLHNYITTPHIIGHSALNSHIIDYYY